MGEQQNGQLYIPFDLAQRLEIDSYLIVAPSSVSDKLGGFDLAVDIVNAPFEITDRYTISIREDKGDLRDNLSSFLTSHKYDRRLCLSEEVLFREPIGLYPYDLLTFSETQGTASKSNPSVLPKSLGELYNSLRNFS